MMKSRPAAAADACGKAMDLQLAGRLELAAEIYRSVLDTDPDHAVANHCLGMLHLQSGKPASGIAHLLAALNAQPQIPDYWLGYLEALLLTARLEEARETLGLAREHGLSGPSVDDFAARLTSRAGAAIAAPAPGAAHDRAARAAQRQIARKLRKEDNALLSLLGERRFTEALARARRITGQFPEHGLGWKILGALLWTEGCSEEALDAMRDSVRLLPNDAEAHSNLGTALASSKRFDEGEIWLRKALAIDPHFAAAHYRLGMHYELQARYDEAEECLREATSLRGGELTVDDAQGFSNLMYVLSHNSRITAAELFAEHRRVGAIFEDAVRAEWPRHANTPDPKRRLKVGFVSGDLRDHSVAMFLEWLLEPLARRDGLALHAYYNYSTDDAVTGRLRKHFDKWTSVPRLSDVGLAQCIQNDGIDILMDLSGHTAENRLRTFARKPAPLQVGWLGYPGSTGLTAMDYYLADGEWLSPGRFDAHFTEKLVYLPDRWAYLPPLGAPPVNRLPALASGAITFGSFHRVSKINDSTLRLWADLLHAVPQSTLLLAGLQDGQHATVGARFGNHGIAGARLKFHGRCGMDKYLELHGSVDIALDAHPYSGATTAMHSLAMGVPTLTFAGATSFARACAGIMQHAGLREFVAADAAGFVTQGAGWAKRLHELETIRGGLRDRLMAAPGGQPGLMAAHLEGALRHMWHRWCTGLPPQSFHSEPVP